jgi:hypothetical protein
MLRMGHSPEPSSTHHSVHKSTRITDISPSVPHIGESQRRIYVVRAAQ